MCHVVLIKHRIWALGGNHLESSAKVCISLGYCGRRRKKKHASIFQFINKTKLCSFNGVFQPRRWRRRWKEVKKKAFSETATGSEKRFFKKRHQDVSEDLEEELLWRKKPSARETKTVFDYNLCFWAKGLKSKMKVCSGSRSTPCTTALKYNDADDVEMASTQVCFYF